MKNIKILQKIRTYVKHRGMVDFFISKELNNKKNILTKNEITKLESYPINNLGNKPIRFIFFHFNDFYILLQSRYLNPVDGDSRIGNFITHSIILDSNIGSINPMDYLHSSCFKLDYESVIKKNLFKKDLSFLDISQSIKPNISIPIFSEKNKQFLLAVIFTYRKNKKLITISNNINPIFEELLYLLPPNIRQDITFSNLEFSKISRKKIFNIYNYSNYSLNLDEMNSYENFHEIMEDAKKLNYLCFNYEDNIFPDMLTIQSRYVKFIFNNQSKIDIFYRFTEQYNYFLSELDLLILLFEYEAKDITLTTDELEQIISFVKKQENKKLLKELFILLQNKQDYNRNFQVFIYSLESFEQLFSKEEFVDILYDGIEEALYDISYDMDLLFKKLFKFCSSDKELKILHNAFINKLTTSKNSKKILKNILLFNKHTFDILKFELKDNYFEFIANTDEKSLIKLIEFYRSKRFPKSLILVKYNHQNIQKYLFSLLENSDFSIMDLANYNMNNEIKAYFEYKRNEISSKTFFEKMIPFQKDELSLLKEFSRKLVMKNDILSSLVEIIILNNTSNFNTLVELYISYARYDKTNKELIFQSLNNILEKKFSKFYSQIDFLEDELYLNIKPYSYLLTAVFIYKINKNYSVDLKIFTLEENLTPLKIIKKNKVDGKILKIVQKKYDTVKTRNNLKDRRLVFKDLIRLQVF